MLSEAGFAEATFHGWTGYFTSSYTQGGLITARKPGGGNDAQGVGRAGGGAKDQEGRTLRVAPLVYGVASYLIFFATFGYAIGFVGDFLVPKTIDTRPRVPMAEALVVDMLLLALFAVPHSVMARPGFKRRWTRLVPPPVERSTYVLVSSLLLALVFWQWHPLPGVVWDARASAARTTLSGLFGAGWLVVLISTFLIDHFDLFGLRQVYLYATGRPYTPPRFRTTALYRVVRHPIMLGFVVAFWATPRMTWGHLLFAALTTVYILIGVRLEERDLRAAFGRRYEAYSRRVPMLVPRIGRGDHRTSRTSSGRSSAWRISSLLPPGGGPDPRGSGLVNCLRAMGPGSWRRGVDNGGRAGRRHPDTTGSL
jgi:protein-S-isoprenylcysteine O-methyltransferase Ste14